jgi:hypothetical protein
VSELNALSVLCPTAAFGDCLPAHQAGIDGPLLSWPAGRLRRAMAMRIAFSMLGFAALMIGGLIFVVGPAMTGELFAALLRLVVPDTPPLTGLGGPNVDNRADAATPSDARDLLVRRCRTPCLLLCSRSATPSVYPPDVDRDCTSRGPARAILQARRSGSVLIGRSRRTPA